MMSDPNTPQPRINRLSHGDPLHRLVEKAYRAYDRPAPRHLAGCSCALCADRSKARMLADRGARDWTYEDVRGWFERVSSAETARSGLQVASRTDRAVFRFLFPRVLELLATGALPVDATTSKVFTDFAPGQMTTDGTTQCRIVSRFAALMLDRALQDPDWPLDVVGTLRVLAVGGWSVPQLVQQAQIDPELPASLARAWHKVSRSEPLFPGAWPNGAVAVVRAAFVTPLMVERLMNFAMADGTSHMENDAAMRAADNLLRSF